MDSKSPDLMQMLSGEMRYMSQRQKVLAQNVANVDTPNYKSQDLKKVDFGQMVESHSSSSLPLATTSPKHLSGNLLGGSSQFATMTTRKPGEVKPTGNDVNLEDEMAKISDTTTQYDLAGSLFKKFTGLYRTALGK